MLEMTQINQMKLGRKFGEGIREAMMDKNQDTPSSKVTVAIHNRVRAGIPELSPIRPKSVVSRNRKR